jgi:hypothetical protein
MEPGRENLSAARRAAARLDPVVRPDPVGRPDPAVLCDAWRQRSLASGWLAADDWDSEAVNAVVAAACGTGPLSLACGRLGRSRAKAGIGIAETIDDLAALFAVLGGGQGGRGQTGSAGRPEFGPPLPLVCSVAEGWAEEGMAQLSARGCEDPLSGLATLPYLSTRLGEVYREAARQGTSPADTHRLLVVSLPRPPDPWHRMALAIVVGYDLRAAFPGGETLSLARRDGTGPALALVGARGDLPIRYTRLRRTIQAMSGAQLRLTRLPKVLAEALRLVDELTP